MMANWERMNSLTGNQILRGDGFYVSYASGSGLSVLGPLGGDGGSDETALVIKTNSGERNTFLVLNGDFRAEYETRVPNGVDACIAFYNEQKAMHASSWDEGASPNPAPADMEE